MSMHIRKFARRGAALACMAAVATTAACGRLSSGGLGPQDARIVFHNETLDQADVYASSGGDFQRIGTVFPNRTDTLVIHSELLQGSGLTVRARLLAKNNAPSTGNITLRSGEMLDIRLPMDERQLIVLPSR